MSSPPEPTKATDAHKDAASSTVEKSREISPVTSIREHAAKLGKEVPKVIVHWFNILNEDERNGQRGRKAERYISK